MSSQMSRSNLPPSAKEAAFLREVLAKHNEELTLITDVIESKRSELALCKAAVQHSVSALKTARQASDVYQRHKANLTSTHQELATLGNDVVSSEKVEAFLAEDTSTRDAVCSTEITAISNSCDRIRDIIRDLEEELRCQCMSVTFSELSLQRSLTTSVSLMNTVDIIKEKFRAIKRIPVEIWLEILGMVIQGKEEWEVTEQDYDLLYPALRLAQVCDLWRRALLDTPRLWTTISYTGRTDKNQRQRDTSIALLVERANGLPLIIVDRASLSSRPLRLGSCWRRRPELVEAVLSKYCYHLRLSENYPKKRSDRQTWPNPLRAIFQAQSLSTKCPLPRAVVGRFKDIQDLTLINIPLLLSSNVVSDVLTNLKIEYNSPVVKIEYDSPAESSSDDSTEYEQDTPNFCIKFVLSSSLQTLEISQYAAGMIRLQGPIFQLPNLQLLSVTPHEYELLRYLDTPSINTLKITYPPGRLTLSFDKWVGPFSTICAIIFNLEVDWREEGLPNAISLFTTLWEHAPKLQTMTFRDAKLDGEELCRVLEKRVGAGNPLTNLTIDGCVGISQTDCERIASMVDRLSVFNTVHKAA